MRKRTLLSLLGLIYGGCGGDGYNSCTDGERDAIEVYQQQGDAAKDMSRLDAGLDELEVALDTYNKEVGEDAGEEISAEVQPIIFCSDSDKDGFFVTAPGCYAPSDKIGDCNDKDKSIFPGAAEVCDGIDNGCNGLTDEELPEQSYYTGTAGTLGVGICKGGMKSCVDGAWKITTSEIAPAATDDCDGQDNNCNTFVDEGQTLSTFYFDNDGDGFGNSSDSKAGCTATDGSIYSNGIKVFNYVTVGGDCQDDDSKINPEATESCNGIDDDCNGQVDEKVLNTYFLDADLDGYGSSILATLEACAAPKGYVDNSSDCDDLNAAINPSVKESCNAFDDDCNGKIDDGLEGTAKCGYNNNGTKFTNCIDGVIADISACADPDECKADDTKPCALDATLPGFKCELEGEVYKWKPTGSETSTAKPDGINNDCDKLVDEDFFAEVPAGEYEVGCDYPWECDYSGNPTHLVQTAGFYIAKFEFTQAQAGGIGDLPKTGVTQSEADLYCKSLGGRLPTAEEWEIAAKGGKAENIYPWGILAPNCNLTNYWYCIGSTMPVGSYSSDQSGFGVFDLGGNVSEWTSTLQGNSAIVKGGNWSDNPTYVPVYTEESKDKELADDKLAGDKIGFRCVLDKIE